MSDKATPSKARKFKPTVPSRRKKAEGEDAVVKQENDENFKDLIRAAQEPANWERRPHVRPGSKSGASQHVAFGGAPTGFATATGQNGARSSGANGGWPGGASGGSGFGNNKMGGGSGGGNVSQGGRSGQGEAQRGDDKSRRIVKLSEPGVDEDLKDQQKIIEPPTAEMDEEDLNLDSYYPTTLPMRQPGSAAPLERPPGGLDAELMADDRDEDVAGALGLLTVDDEPRPADIILQLPSVLPSPVVHSKDEPLDRRRRLSLHEPQAPRKTAYSLSELPPGKIGKLLVFESGKVKLQLGDVLLDITRAADCQCFQHVVAMNMEAKTAVSIGEIQHKVICTPDMEQLLSDSPVPQWERVPPDSPVRGIHKKLNIKKPTSPSSPKNPKSPKLENRTKSIASEPVPMEIDDKQQLNGTLAEKNSIHAGRKAAVINSDDE